MTIASARSAMPIDHGSLIGRVDLPSLSFMARKRSYGFGLAPAGECCSDESSVTAFRSAQHLP
jgi:hypothetical protein